MTFCLGIIVNEGLVGISDTRLLSGNEALVAKKVATYQGPGFSFFVMTSGLRSLRDKVLLCFEESYAQDVKARDRLFKIANLYGSQVRRVAEEERDPLFRSGLRFDLYSLIGGQMSADSAHRWFLIHPEGNWGGDWGRYAVSDYRGFRLRQAYSGARDHLQQFDSVWV